MVLFIQQLYTTAISHELKFRWKPDSSDIPWEISISAWTRKISIAVRSYIMCCQTFSLDTQDTVDILDKLQLGVVVGSYRVEVQVAHLLEAQGVLLLPEGMLQTLKQYFLTKS